MQQTYKKCDRHKIFMYLQVGKDELVSLDRFSTEHSAAMNHNTVTPSCSISSWQQSWTGPIIS
jgi:hypothetical protein